MDLFWLLIIICICVVCVVICLCACCICNSKKCRNRSSICWNGCCKCFFRPADPNSVPGRGAGIAQAQILRRRQRENRRKNLIVKFCRIGYSQGPLNLCYRYFGTFLRVLIWLASLPFAAYLTLKLAEQGWNDCLALYSIVLASAVLFLIVIVWFFFVHLECSGGWHWGETWIFACLDDDGYYEDRMETFQIVFTVLYNLSHWAILIFLLTNVIKAYNRNYAVKDYLCPSFSQETIIYLLLNLFELICSLAVECIHGLVKCGAYCGLKRRKRRQPIEQPGAREGSVNSNLSSNLLEEGTQAV